MTSNSIPQASTGQGDGALRPVPRFIGASVSPELDADLRASGYIVQTWDEYWAERYGPNVAFLEFPAGQEPDMFYDSKPDDDEVAA